MNTLPTETKLCCNILQPVGQRAAERQIEFPVFAFNRIINIIGKRKGDDGFFRGTGILRSLGKGIETAQKNGAADCCLQKKTKSMLPFDCQVLYPG